MNKKIILLIIILIAVILTLSTLLFLKSKPTKLERLVEIATKPESNNTEQDYFEYKEQTDEVTLDIKPFTYKKLVFNISTQEIEGRVVSAKNVHFVNNKNIGKIYYKNENLMQNDILFIYSKPENTSLEDYLFQISTSDFAEYEKTDFKKACKLEEFYYGNYIFRQDESLTDYLEKKYGDYRGTFFCISPKYTFLQNENIIIANPSIPMDASAIRVPIDPIESRLRLIND